MHSRFVFQEQCLVWVTPAPDTVTRLLPRITSEEGVAVLTQMTIVVLRHYIQRVTLPPVAPHWALLQPSYLTHSVLL